MSSHALHVAVGVIQGADKRILITQRARHAHQGGLWEFPGGKVETGETVTQALYRELREELDITVKAASPLIKISHHYPDRHVLLDVWQIHAFNGSPRGCEGQEMHWVEPPKLKTYEFPAANQSIVSAVLLPRRYAILEGSSHEDIMHKLELILAKGVTLIQFRGKSLPTNDRTSIYDEVSARCQSQAATLLLNSDLGLSRKPNDGLHLSSRALLSQSKRPPCPNWVGASCHNFQELEHAQRIGVDFVVIAPVQLTRSHPDALPLGWEKLQHMIEQTNLPVFALGGLTINDLDRAIASGAQGVSGISTFL